jgi:hypothetical protein
VSEFASARGFTACGRCTIGAGLGSGKVGKKVEDVLEATKNGMVDGELAVEDLLEVGTDVAKAKVEAL